MTDRRSTSSQPLKLALALVMAAGCSEQQAPQLEQRIPEQQMQAPSGVASTATARELQFTYVKASNPGVGDQFGGGGAAWGNSLAISRDGSTLAVGARMEDGSPVGGQADDSLRDAGAVYIFTRNGNDWVQQAYLKASNADSGDQFGFFVVLSNDGNTLAVSASTEDGAATGINGDQSDNSITNAGAVYVFVRDGEEWTQQAYIKASNTGEPDNGDTFGYSLAISGDGNTLAVGALGEDSAATGIDGDHSDNSADGAGAVYVFVRDGGSWSQQAYVKASNTGASDLFGSAVALSDNGDTLAVGALDEDGGSRGTRGDDADDSAGGSGAVYVYTRQGTTWSQQAYLKSSDSEQQDAFGVAVALSADGDTLAVGALDEDSFASGVNPPTAGRQRSEWEEDRSIGAAYVFIRDGGVWHEQAHIKPSNPGLYDQFAVRVALTADGDLLAVGTPLEDGGGRGLDPVQDDAAEDGGAVYLFSRTSSSWAQTGYLKAPNGDEYDEFGAALAFDSGGTLAVGSRGEDGGASGVGGDQADNSVRDAGAVYLFGGLPR